MTLLEKAVINALETIKAKNINQIPVTNITTITNKMIIATGTSTTHVKAIANKVITAAKSNNIQPVGVEGTHAAEWVLIDLGDIIVHVMLSATRNYYELEKIWSTTDEVDEELMAISA